MRRSEALTKLRDAFAALREERDDKGAGLTFKDVWVRAEVSRAVAYRPETGFRAEFDAAMAAMEGGKVGPGMDVDHPDTRAGYRVLVAQLANQVQVLALELDRERRRNRAAPPPDTGANVVAFPPGRESR